MSNCAFLVIIIVLEAYENRKNWRFEDPTVGEGIYL